MHTRRAHAGRLLVLAVVLVVACPRSSRAQDFYLKDGDRVVFYGDSITEQREYTSRVEEFVLTRFPSLHVTFWHAGVGGDRVTGGWAGTIDERLDRDVVRFEPTVVTIMLGMNDGGYAPLDQAAFDTYAKGYRHILDRLSAALPGVRLTLIQPSPFDDVTRAPTVEGGYNAVLEKYSAFVAALGKERGALVVDFNTPVADGLRRLNVINGLLARQVLPDRVHPAAAGHWLMAEALLRAWRAPSLVSAVDVDAAAVRLVRADGTMVTGLAKGDRGLEWTAHDAALPIPQRFDNDGTMELAAAAGGRMAELNVQRVKVSGLPDGNYRLVIDDGPSGIACSAAQLAAGLDLGGVDTPMVRQAMDIRWASEDKNAVHEQWMRAMVRSKTDAGAADTARRLESLEAQETADREVARQPLPHRFRVVPEGR